MSARPTDTCGHRRCAWYRVTSTGLLTAALGCAGVLAVTRTWPALAAFFACAVPGLALLGVTCPDPVPDRLPRKWTRADLDGVDDELKELIDD